MKALKRVITFMLFALIGMTCTKEDTPKAGKGNKVEVSTLSISPTVSTVVNISGSVKTDMLELIIERGFCWNNTQLPTINDNSLKVSVSGGFNATISGLVPGTNYSIRAYIKTTNDLVYGNEVKFKTINIPIVFTSIISGLTNNTAISGGSISSDGGSNIISRGICWNTTGSPTVANTRTQDGTGVGAFSSTLTGLTPGTLYYARAYATNAAGTAYGAQITFTTVANPVITLPTLSTSSVSSITTTTALSGGSISADGGGSITSRGVCWNTTGSPTVANTRTQNGTGVGAFSSSLTGLTPGTLYYARAYATNAAGTAYGAQITFTTVANPIITLPTLSTSSVSSITTTTALSGGSISADGGSSITSRGVCWNTTGSPTVANTRTQNGTGVGAFSSSLTGLTPGTLYYARAYATNAAGTAYGTQIVFTTSPAVVETCSISTATNGTVYTMQTPALGTIVNAGSLYKITMASPIFSFGQASEVAIYRNETKVFSFGTFLLFNESPGNARTFTIPAGLVSSSCYTIRVTKPEGTITAVYVSPRFEIR
jgi:hypothetical protein